MLIPDSMDVPLNRRDTSDPVNVRWLLRNLPSRNRQHPQFNVVINRLKKLSGKDRTNE